MNLFTKQTHVSQKFTTMRIGLSVLLILSMTKSQAEILRKGSSPSHIVLGKGGEMLFNLVLREYPSTWC